ncbi:MAG TPA: multiheme c-type cytochrome [Acidobacteriota bacterium]|nr:multiheme c-type cytochrome [Acidobacteriota bacterium]
MIVDSGDLLNEDEVISESARTAAELKAELIVSIYQQLGINAANVGELDLALGVDYLKSLAEKKNFPFISANLVDENGRLIFKPYVTTTVNGKTIGIFGLMGDTAEMASRVNEITNGTVRVKDILEASAAIVKELEGKVDYLIALTHQRANRDWVVARRVAGIDLVVGGHDTLKTPDPLRAGDTLIVRAGEMGQRVGILEVSLDDPASAVNELVPVSETIPDKPEIRAMITAYNDRLADIYGAGNEIPDPTSVVSRVQTCAPCHKAAVAQWEASDHAKAYSTLLSRERNFDPSCLVCHTTLFDQPGGFSMAQQQMELVNVGCESCHGYGEEHRTTMAPIPIPKPELELCVRCHTPGRDPTFVQDAQQEFEKIRHW